MVTMTLTLKKSLLKISHGYMADTSVSALKNQFLLSIKTVDVRSFTTMAISDINQVQ
jgi:hypothetical protein